MIVSTTNILVLHTAKIVHFHYISHKSSKRTLNPTMHVLIRHSTPTFEVFLHRDATRHFQRITICMHWSLIFYSTSEDEASPPPPLHQYTNP